MDPDQKPPIQPIVDDDFVKECMVLAFCEERRTVLDGVYEAPQRTPIACKSLDDLLSLCRCDWIARIRDRDDTRAPRSNLLEVAQHAFVGTVPRHQRDNRNSVAQ